MDWFAFGINPLLHFLERRLEGITVASLPVLGPVQHNDEAPLPPVQERFKLQSATLMNSLLLTLEPLYLNKQQAPNWFQGEGSWASPSPMLPHPPISPAHYSKLNLTTTKDL